MLAWEISIDKPCPITKAAAKVAAAACTAVVRRCPPRDVCDMRARQMVSMDELVRRFEAQGMSSGEARHHEALAEVRQLRLLAARLLLVHAPRAPADLGKLSISKGGVDDRLAIELQEERQHPVLAHWRARSPGIFLYAHRSKTEATE